MSSRLRAILLLISGLVAMIATATPAVAHPARMASGIATVNPDGRVTMSLTFDVPAYLLNDTPARVSDSQMLTMIDGSTELLEAKIESGRKRFARAIRVLVDSKEVSAEVTKFPTTEEVVASSHVNGVPRLPVILKAELALQLPPKTSLVQFRISDVIDTLILTVERDDHEAIGIPLQAGSDSDPVPVTIVVPTTQSLAEVPATQPAVVASSSATHDPSPWHVASQYVVIGFEHIVPEGLDHILFVLGLFLLSPKVKPLLTQVTCFTIAHSITLALATFGVVRVPGAIVEPIIALSIAFIAFENLWTANLSPWRPFVIFAFGLVHGLGFAGALQETGLPRSSFIPAIISFNVGVELGQLAVIAAAFAVVGWARNRQWYRGAVVWPASIAIALMGLYWTVERVFT